MGALVLQTRIEMALRNLDKVSHVLESIDERRAVLTQLLTLAATASDEVAVLETGLTALQKAWGNPRLQTIGEQGLQNVADAVENLGNALANVQEHVDAIRLRSAAFAEGGRPQWLSETIGEGTKQQVKGLQEILGEIGPTIGAPPAAALGTAWKDYQEVLHGQSEQVFAEYVDLLGGFALRDAGFDEGICDLADALVRSCVPVTTWNSLTVPARHEALSMTMARIIRLGFPEWSIWAVPLAAHEFGHVRIGKDASMEHLAAWDGMGGTTAEHVRILVVDAYATRILGPAYASAAVLMRLDPWRAADEDGLIAKRAAVILGMLTPGDDVQVDAYEAVIATLETEWRDALSQCGVAVDLGEDVQAQIAAIIAAVRDTLGFPFSLAETYAGTTVEWGKLLAAGEPGQIDLEDVDEFPLRYVLNAAWLARLSNDGSKLDTIGDATFAVWQRIEAVLRATGKAPAPPPPHRSTPAGSGGVARNIQGTDGGARPID
jgi:hypothetical protein